MKIYVRTRGYNKDYKWLSNEKNQYDDNWIENNYKDYCSDNYPALIFQRDNDDYIKIYVTGIPSERKDNNRTDIRYTLAFDVDFKGTENKEYLKKIVKAWLYERLHAKEKKVKVGNDEIKLKILELSAIGKYLDTKFNNNEYVDDLLSGKTRITASIIDLKKLVEICEEEAKNINNKDDYKEKNIDGYYICNLKNNENKYENVNIFYSFICNIIDQNGCKGIITCAFFNMITDLESIIKAIKNNQVFPKILCVDLDNFDYDKINSDSFDIDNINDSCICLKKKQKIIPQMVANKKEIKTKEQIQTPSKDQQLTKTSTNNILTVVMTVSLIANLILIPLAIYQNKQKTILTENQKIMKKELQKLEKTLEEFKQKEQVLTNEKEILNQEKDQLSNKNTEIQNQQKKIQEENQEQENAQNLSHTKTEK